MSTPIDRAAEMLVWSEGDGTVDYWRDRVHAAFAAALDVPELARLLTAHVFRKSERRCACGADWSPRHQAEAVRDHLLDGPP